jgi:fatty acid desaturase
MASTVAHPLPSARVRELSRASTARALVRTALDWALIVLAIAISERVRHPAIYVLAVMLVGSLQHSIHIQMHDAAHGRLSKSRLVNDVVGELCAWPMFVRMAAYREVHRLHHKHLNSERDPDFRSSRFPKTRRELVVMLARDLVGLNTLEQLGELKRFKKPTTRRVLALRIAFYVTLAVGLTALGLWRVYLVYWVLPIFTWLKFVLRLRAIADHAGVEGLAKPFDARVIVPNLFDRVFLAPRHCSYHIGHHLYQGVPSFNLKALHHELMKNDEIRQRTHVTRGFWRLFFEFASSRSHEPESPRRRGAVLAAVNVGLTTLK